MLLKRDLTNTFFLKSPTIYADYIQPSNVVKKNVRKTKRRLPLGFYGARKDYFMVMNKRLQRSYTADFRLVDDK